MTLECMVQCKEKLVQGSSFISISAGIKTVRGRIQSRALILLHYFRKAFYFGLPDPRELSPFPLLPSPPKDPPIDPNNSTLLYNPSPPLKREGTLHGITVGKATTPLDELLLQIGELSSFPPIHSSEVKRFGLTVSLRGIPCYSGSFGICGTCTYTEILEIEGFFRRVVARDDLQDSEKRALALSAINGTVLAWCFQPKGTT